MGIHDRLARLEGDERARGEGRVPDLRDWRACRAHYFAQQRLRMADFRPPAVHRVRDLVGLFALQDRMPETTDELVEMVLEWQPPMEELTRSVAEREVSWAIYRGKPGTDHLAAIPRWRESFQAGAEICRLYERMADHELVALLLRGGADFDAKHGISDDLIDQAIGPDLFELEETPEGENVAAYRMAEYLEPVLLGDQCWRAHRLISLMSEREREQIREAGG